MKSNFMAVIVAITAFASVSEVYAYQYTFSNHTNKRIAAAIRFKTSRWREFTVMAPHTGGTIAHGNKYIPDVQTEIPSNQSGFIPSEFFYYEPKAGEKMTTANQEKVAWKGISITWIPTEKYNSTLDLVEKIGELTEQAAKTAAKAGAAYATGGASVGADAAAELAQQGNQGALDVAKEFAERDYDLGKLFAAIGKSASRELIGNYHIDIVQDSKGYIKFLVRLK
jgi:hypothetical protein